MKTNFLLSFLFLLFSFYGFAQCEGGIAESPLSVNNIDANLRIGDLWWDGENAGYEFPKGSGRHLLFAGGLWMAGLDEGNNLHLAAQTYGGPAAAEYFPGPIVDGSTTADMCTNWDRFFSVTTAEIQAHKSDFDDNGIIGNPVPNSILGWPGSGNPHFTATNGFDLPDDQNLAPFFDRNENGVYEPMEGDFPKIKGDQATWWVFNDIGNVHASSMAEPLGMEIQIMAYAYDNDIEALNNTTFYEYKLLYRGSETLSDFHLSLWVDPDIGCSTDDYIGCVSSENMGYAYNGSAFDQSCNGVSGYWNSIPVIGVKLLNDNFPNGGGLKGFSYYLNSAQPIAPQPGMTDPETAPEIYNYMRGLWRDGTPITRGGTGYDPLNSNVYPFAFDDDVIINGFPWSECSINNSSGDRRMLLNFGGFDLLPSQILSFTTAVIVSTDVAYPCPDISPLIEDGNLIATIDEEATLASNTLNPKPAALFTKVLQSLGLTNFEDQSLFNPTSWAWDFGDGNTSQQQNPTHTYFNEGLYTVCLTVANDFGEDTTCEEIDIKAVVAPIAGFTFTGNEFVVDFQDESLNNPNEWSWSFGDGNLSSDENVTHTYENEGEYYVCLTVSNDLGEDTHCETVVLEYTEPPIADFTFDTFLSFGVFTNNSQRASSFLWDFGDGSTSTSESPNHLFPPGGGVYEVCLEAINSQGSDTVCKEVDFTTSINNLGELTYLVQPNPAKDHLQLVFNGLITNPLELNVYNRIGQQLELGTTQNAQQIRLDIKGLPSGLYLFELLDPRTGHRSTGKFVKE